MKIRLELDAPRWTIKNAEKFLEWFLNESRFREARIVSAYAGDKDLLSLYRNFKY